MGTLKLQPKIEIKSVSFFLSRLHLASSLQKEEDQEGQFRYAESDVATKKLFQLAVTNLTTGFEYTFSVGIFETLKVPSTSTLHKAIIDINCASFYVDSRQNRI